MRPYRRVPRKPCASTKKCRAPFNPDWRWRGELSPPRAKADTIGDMFARLNFLFAVSILTLLAFYLPGRFIFHKAILALAPALAPYFIAAYMLAALMLTVLVLAKTVIRLDAISSLARARKSTARTILAQSVLLLAHLCTLFAIYTMFSADSGGERWWLWLVTPVLYAAGITLAVADLQKRALQASG